MRIGSLQSYEKLLPSEVAKVMFLQASVCPQGGWGCLPQCMLAYHTPSPEPVPPWEQTHPRSRHPPGADTPLRADTPREQTPLEADTPRADTSPRADTPREQTPSKSRHPPGSRHPPRYGHCCGWYASYWNAFLLPQKLLALRDSQTCWSRNVNFN